MTKEEKFVKSVIEELYKPTQHPKIKFSKPISRLRRDEVFLPKKILDQMKDEDLVMPFDENDFK